MKDVRIQAAAGVEIGEEGDDEEAKDRAKEQAKELETFLRTRKEREEAMNADLMANVRQL